MLYSANIYNKTSALKSVLSFVLRYTLKQVLTSGLGRHLLPLNSHFFSEQKKKKEKLVDINKFPQKEEW